MNGQTLILQIIIWTLDIVTILATIAFFCSFRKIEEKNDGLHMIFILTTVDLLSSLFNLLEIFILQGPSDVNFVASTETILFRFSLFWSAAIAIFVHLAYKQYWRYTVRAFLIWAFIICLALSAIYPIA
jgi:membrane-associated HD superfamily phosphohydrolase